MCLYADVFVQNLLFSVFVSLPVFKIFYVELFVCCESKIKFCSGDGIRRRYGFSILLFGVVNQLLGYLTKTAQKHFKKLSRYFLFSIA